MTHPPPQTDRNRPDASANSLTGLIGERGAVGAFQAYYRCR